MATRKIVYFDTNVIRDLSELRGQITTEKLDIIKSYIEKGTLVVAPGFEVLDELLRSPDITQEKRIQNAQFYDGIVDWKQTVKPSNNMIVDDIISLAKNRAPSSPYRAVDADKSGFIQSIRKGENVLPDDVWNRTVKDAETQNEQFVDLLFKQFVRKLPEKSKQELKAKPDKIWNRWWSERGLAFIIASSLSTKIGVSQDIPLLSLPSVRSCVGYFLDTWRSQILDNMKVKPTAHIDFRNAVIAGGVGRIITNDKKFGNTIDRIPGLGVEVLTLEGLIAHIH